MRKDWIKIKTYYITHDISLEKLAKKFKVSVSAVNAHCRKEKWTAEKTEKRQEIERKVTEKTVNREIERKIAENEKHIGLLDDSAEIIEGLMKLYKERLIESTAKKIKIKPDQLEKLISCVEKVQKGHRLALNMEKEDVKDDAPKLVMVENLDLNKI